MITKVCTSCGELDDNTFGSECIQCVPGLTKGRIEALADWYALPEQQRTKFIYWLSGAFKYTEGVRDETTLELAKTALAALETLKVGDK